MGFSAFTYWNSSKDTMGIYMFIALVVALQLWWLKFGKSCGKTERNWSLASILAIACFAALLAVQFWNVSKIAGLCMVPLVIWLLFASFLLATTEF
jgi:tryptophan-rich sensory protein